MQVAHHLTKCNFTYLKTINFVQYLRFSFGSFGEEDFQRYELNLLCSNSIWLLFHQSCRLCPPFEQTLITHTGVQGLFVCNISEFCRVVLEKKIFKVS